MTSVDDITSQKLLTLLERSCVCVCVCVWGGGGGGGGIFHISCILNTWCINLSFQCFLISPENICCRYSLEVALGEVFLMNSHNTMCMFS